MFVTGCDNASSQASLGSSKTILDIGGIVSCDMTNQGSNA